MGVSVYRVRYLALIIGAMLAALGGMTMVMAQTGFWSDNVTAGRGLIAIALVRVGNWRTHITFAAALAVGALLALTSDLQQLFSGGGTVSTTFPYEVFSMLPYIFAVAVIGIAYKWTRSNQPASIGKPYRRE
jgi:simple sugar transport system permease protein